jgi:hypothetical protein
MIENLSFSAWFSAWSMKEDEGDITSKRKSRLTPGTFVFTVDTIMSRNPEGS